MSERLKRAFDWTRARPRKARRALTGRLRRSWLVRGRHYYRSWREYGAGRRDALRLARYALRSDRLVRSHARLDRLAERIAGRLRAPLLPDVNMEPDEHASVVVHISGRSDNVNAAANAARSAVRRLPGNGGRGRL